MSSDRFDNEGEARSHLRSYPAGGSLVEIFDENNRGMETVFEADDENGDRYACLRKGKNVLYAFPDGFACLSMFRKNAGISAVYDSRKQEFIYHVSGEDMSRDDIFWVSGILTRLSLSGGGLPAGEQQERVREMPADYSSLERLAEIDE